MSNPTAIDVERRALALFERLSSQPENLRFRNRVLQNEPEAVLARLDAFEASVARAQRAIPTLIPGSADCDNTLPPPQKVGPYRLIEKIARGGMGDVWLGRRDDGLYEQKVAIKLIQRHALVKAGAAFDDERRFLARLEHPNIARLIDGGLTEDGLPWLVMEFFEGVAIDVASKLRTDPERVALFIRAADAVQYVHSRLIAHADLKPSNIIVNENGRVKLLDFGISRLIGAGEHVGVGSGPVTREFASPERLKGAGPSVGDDVFALGKTFALMLEGSKDADLAAISQKAQNPDELLRYGSAAAMIADLDLWRARLPVSSVVNTRRYRAKKFIGRHRIGVLATAAAMLLLSATSVIATANYIRAERETRYALARFEDARGASRYISLDLLSDLATRPGTLTLRTEAALVAQQYLDRLAESRSAPSAVRLEAAEGLLRLAAAQGRPGDPNLGQVDAAKRNLQRAWQLAGQIDGTDAQLLKVRIRLDQARLVSMADNTIEQALSYLEEAQNLLEQNKTAPALLRVQYYAELASSLEWKGDYAAAIRAVRIGKALLPQDEKRDTLLLNAAIVDLLAEANFYAVNGKAAIAPYREALAILERAAVLFPKDQIVVRRLMRAKWALATTIVDNGSPGEALRLIEQSSVIGQNIVASDPEDQDAQRMLRISENARGQVLAANGRIDEGIGLFKANVAERRSLWESRPGDAMRLRDYMVAVKALGDMQTTFGQKYEGCQSYLRASSLIAELERRGRLTGMDAIVTRPDMTNRELKFCATSGRVGKN